MRAFLAVEFPDNVKDAYAEARREFTSRFSSLRWVRSDCVHLTIRFLGDITDEAAAELEEPVTRVAGDTEPFRISLGAPGFFGSRSSPRVFWVAVDEGGDALAELQPKIERLIRRCGHAPDTKPWTPHVTLARSRGGRRQRNRSSRSRAEPTIDASDWLSVASDCGLPGIGFDLTALTLMSSDLTPEGPIYTPVWRAKLGVS